MRCDAWSPPVSWATQAHIYWLTEAGQALHARWRKRGGLFSWTDIMPQALHKLGEQKQLPAHTLPDGAFDDAVREYLQQSEG